MSRVLTRVVAGLLGVVLVILIVLMALLPSAGEERSHSSYSASADGMRAAYLLLQGLGFEVAPWSATPGRLAGEGALLFVAEIPEEPTSGPTPPPSAPDAAPVPAPRSRDLLHYRRFLEEGGTLLMTRVQDEELAFLRDTLALEGLDGLQSEPNPDEGTTLVLASGEELELARSPAHRITGLGPEDVALARAPDGSVIALSRAVGAGRLLLLTLPASTFHNDSLEQKDGAALLLVRLVETPPRAERILFDEYALGGWQPGSALDLAFSPRLALWIAHLLLLGLVLTWRSAWPGPFARDPEPLGSVSPLARAQGFGGLLARAGRFDVLARLLKQGTLSRWAARAGVRLATPRAGALPRETVEDTLRTLARGDGRLLARARVAFLERVPRDADELTELDRELAQLGRELFRRAEHGKTARGIGARAAATGS